MKRTEENYAEFFKKANSIYLDCEKNITILHLTSSFNTEILRFS